LGVAYANAHGVAIKKLVKLFLSIPFFSYTALYKQEQIFIAGFPHVYVVCAPSTENFPKGLLYLDKIIKYFSNI
jgi:hypothetical protein